MRSCALAFVAALSFAAHCLAQDACLKAPDAAAAPVVRTQIGLKRAQQCYDVKAHTPASLEAAVKLLDKADQDQASAERKRTVAGLLELLREWAQTGVREAALRESLQRKLSEARTALAAGEVSKEVVDPASWRIVERPRDRALISNVSAAPDLAAPIDARCPEPAACSAAIADLEAVLRSHALVEVALLVARKDELSDLADLFAKRASMWDAYRTEARPQYPWEWMLNGVLYRDDRDTDRAGNPIGPASLPKGQVVFLHPGVGLERFDIRGTDQSASNPTLYIEWLGYNRLTWDSDAGKLRGGIGVSLVSVYSSRQDAKDWSNGVMFWVSNKYGLAVTRNSDGTSIMVSVDVGELFRDQLNQLNRLIPGAGTR